MKLGKSKKINIILMASIVFLFTVALSLGITAAMYTWGKDLKGSISFHDSINIETYGISGTGNERSLMYYDGVGGTTELTLNGLQQTDEIRIVNPSVQPADSTASYYLRAKLTYTSKNGSSENATEKVEAGYVLTEEDIDTLFSEKLVFDSANWLEYNGYYYLVGNNQPSWNYSKLNKQQLVVNAVGAGEVSLFTSSCKLVVNDIENTSDMILKVGAIDIKITLDAIQATAGGFGAWEKASVTYNYNIAVGTTHDQKGSTYGNVITEDADKLETVEGVDVVTGYEDDEVSARVYVKDGYLFKGWKAYMAGQEVALEDVFQDYEIKFNKIYFTIKKTDASLGDVTLLAEVEQDLTVYTTYNLSIIVGTANASGYYGEIYGTVANPENLELFEGTDLHSASVKKNAIVSFEYEIAEGYELVDIKATDSENGFPGILEDYVGNYYIEGNRITFDAYGAGNTLRIVILVQEIPTIE